MWGVLIAVTITIPVVWDLTSHNVPWGVKTCCLAHVYRRFEETTFSVSRTVSSSTLRSEAADSFETLISGYQTTAWYILVNRNSCLIQVFRWYTICLSNLLSESRSSGVMLSMNWGHEDCCNSESCFYLFIYIYVCIRRQMNSYSYWVSVYYQNYVLLHNTSHCHDQNHHLQYL
jgi:hypothetical protein